LNFAAQKFFVGLVDFFSIFLPGATLAYVIRNWVYSTFLGPNMHPPIDRGEAGLVFLFGSYLLGHLIFLLATILDERIYHPLRALIDWGQITKRLVKDKDLSTHLATPACHFRFVVWHRCRRGRHAGATNEGARSRPWKANTPSTLIQWWQGALDEGPACRFVGRATLRGRFQILSKLFRRAGSAVSYLRIAPTRACGQARFHWNAACPPYGAISISVAKRHNKHIGSYSRWMRTGPNQRLYRAMID
jgi:hypothetical protein